MMSKISLQRLQGREEQVKMFKIMNNYWSIKLKLEIENIVSETIKTEILQTDVRT